MEQLTTDSFEKAIASSTPVVIDFWAPWCGPCRLMGPVFEELSKEYSNAKFAKLNTEDYPEMAAMNGVMGIPTVIVFQDGKELGRFSGFGPKPVLKQMIDDILLRSPVVSKRL